LPSRRREITKGAKGGMSVKWKSVRLKPDLEMKQKNSDLILKIQNKYTNLSRVIKPMLLTRWFLQEKNFGEILTKLKSGSKTFPKINLW